MPSDPIVRRKLSDLIQERLLDQIQNGGLAPGDDLQSERELMTQYQVGRPAVREAMQNLQRMGLVEIKHGERPRVAQPSMDRVIDNLAESMQHVLAHSAGSLENLKEARLVFETAMTGIAARRCTAENISNLERVLETQAKATQPSAEFTALDGEFHLEIAKFSGNPVFTALSASLFSWLTDFHRHLVQSPGHENVTLLEHRAILDAIRAGDEPRAVKEMQDHLNRASALYSVKNRGANTGPADS